MRWDDALFQRMKGKIGRSVIELQCIETNTCRHSAIRFVSFLHRFFFLSTRNYMYKINVQKKNNYFTAKQDYCSYKEFKNLTLPWSDVKIEGLDESGASSTAK